MFPMKWENSFPNIYSFSKDVHPNYFKYLREATYPSLFLADKNGKVAGRFALVKPENNTVFYILIKALERLLGWI